MPALTTRRGATLVELIMSLGLFGVISTAAFATLAMNQRTHSAIRQNMDLQQNMRAAGNLLPAELRELDSPDGDIAAMSASSLSIRAMRRLAFLCEAPVLGGVLTGRTLTIGDSPFFGTRAFAANDSIFMFYEGNPELRTDDGWVLGKVTSVSNKKCADGRDGKQLNLDLNLNGLANAAGAITIGAPIRGYERVRYHAYQNAADGNKYYLGLETANGTQPLVGPLTGSEGLAFTYYDAAGAATAVTTNVASIGVVVKGVTSKPVRKTGGGIGTVTDSIVTRVALRNNRRF